MPTYTQYVRRTRQIKKTSSANHTQNPAQKQYATAAQNRNHQTRNKCTRHERTTSHQYHLLTLFMPLPFPHPRSFRLSSFTPPPPSRIPCPFPRKTPGRGKPLNSLPSHIHAIQGGIEDTVLDFTAVAPYSGSYGACEHTCCQNSPCITLFLRCRIIRWEPF